MQWIGETWRRLVFFFRREQFHRELEEEMSEHLRMKANDLGEEGMPSDEARNTAKRGFGNALLLRERSRDAWGFAWLETLLQDVRYGLRQLRRNPGFTAVAVVTLALGIGANTAIFSVVNAALLEPLPFRRPGRLVQLWETEQAPGNYPLTGPDYLDWQAQNRTLAATTLYSWTNNENLSGVGEPQPVRVVSTQANFFSTLGASPFLGRGFARGEDVAGRDRVAVLSYSFWQAHFGGQSSAIGKTIELNDRPYLVIGVMPRWFNFPSDTQIWTSLDMSPANLGPRGSHNWRVIARMKPGVTATQAQADLTAVETRLGRIYPDNDKDVKAVAVLLQEQLTRGWRGQLLILLGAVACVLLIACANLANLLLATAMGRQREIAVRAALGAGPWRLARQLLTESVTLALAGAAVGLVGAWWLVLWVQNDPRLPIPRTHPIAVDWRVLLFTFGISVFVGILFGLAPALRLSDRRLAEELKVSAQAVLGPAGASGVLRDALVVAEIALSLALLIGAGLLLRTFANMRNANIGVRTSGLLTARLSLPEARYASAPARRAFLNRLLLKIQHSPGVHAATLSWNIPLEGGTNGYVTVPGNTNRAIENQLVEWDFVTPDYFRTYGIPLLQGRNFKPADAQRAAADADKIFALYKAAKGGKPKIPAGISFPAIINRVMARTFWPKRNPIGKAFDGGVGHNTVIGVVGDVHEAGITSRVRPEAYWPFPVGLAWGSGANLTVETWLKPLNLLPAIRNEVRSLDSQLALSQPRTMREVVSDHMQDTRLQTVLLGLFAALAVFLASIGIYGVVAFLVTQRTREIGIRIAFGAQRGDILRMVLINSGKLILLGLGTGLAAAFALTRILASELFAVSPTDPITFTAVSAFLAAIAFAACIVPARRAAKVDPMVALRHE
jgi:putative ABC transport system permease protein